MSEHKRPLDVLIVVLTFALWLFVLYAGGAFVS